MRLSTAAPKIWARGAVTLGIALAAALTVACAPVQQAAGPGAAPATDVFGTPADPAAVQRGGTLTMALS
ncbi:MAG TPA: hypothetical protein VFE39_13520, partial [Pseudonocardia sp.]|nr:hypothetical protein [Pseudonocardia sp.]